MKRVSLTALTFMAAAVLAACGRNAPKPVAEAPSLEALLALEKQANEAYMRGDSRFFEGLLSEKFVMREDGHRMDKAAVVKMIAGLLSVRIVATSVFSAIVTRPGCEAWRGSWSRSGATVVTSPNNGASTASLPASNARLYTRRP